MGGHGGAVPARRRGSAPGIRALVDLLGWVAAFVGATALKGAVLVLVLGIDPREIPSGDPWLYGVEYLTPLVLLPALTWLLHRRGERWRDLGLSRPGSWRTFLGWSFGATGVALVLNRLLRALPGLWGGSWGTSPFAALAGDPTALIVLGTYTVFLVGLTEELAFRGFLMSRLARVFGGGGRGWMAAAVTTAVVFGALHAGQGPLGVLNGFVLGLLFGIVYLSCGRSLWVVVLAHSLYDTVRLVQYIGL